MENLQAVLTEEGLVSFECKVVGFPTPVLSWFKDGQELKPGDVYQLTGTNSLGKLPQSILNSCKNGVVVYNIINKQNYKNMVFCTVMKIHKIIGVLIPYFFQLLLTMLNYYFLFIFNFAFLVYGIRNTVHYILTALINNIA